MADVVIPGFIPSTKRRAGPKEDALTHFEVGNEAGHAPVVELAAADFVVGGVILFGDQVEFLARQIGCVSMPRGAVSTMAQLRSLESLSQ